jgi:16S rRNA (adenine1518-N6/adenine1519-N6)-dimethyltransferase
LPAPRAVVSNLPYYITGPLVTKIAEARAHYDKAVLMMQKEVARRFLALPGDSDRGSISVYLQALFTIKKVQDVPAGAFVPPPKVDSTILELVPNGASFEPEFFEMVRQGFDQPRKTLANNLNGFSGLTREQVQERLEGMSLSKSIRPHEVKLDEWIGLHRELRASNRRK